MLPAVTQLAPSDDATETTAPVVVLGLVAAATSNVRGWRT
jgi:hypothetical protein